MAEPNVDSKMSRFMPTLFNSEFSKTYADLLKNVAPLEHRSDATESDYTLYPVLGGDSGRKTIIEGGIKIDSKAMTAVGSPLRISMVGGPKPGQLEQQKPIDPELHLYMEVLQRIKNTHKHVVNDDALRQARKDYRKYLGDPS